MRILVVSTLPPRQCGIGTYADAQVARLREEGHDVTVISPPDGRGDVQVSFEDGCPFREADRRGADADRIIVHFQPGLYYRPGAAAAVSKIRTSYGLHHLVERRPQVEILVHEAHRPTRWRPDHVILRRAFARASLLFHTDAERRAFASDYRLEPRGRLIEHAEAVSSVVAKLGRTEARLRLGLDPAEPLLLCAGFIHPWKGFDRAIRAFAASNLRGRLAIVGSVREHAAAIDTYAAELRALVAATDGAQLVETFQTDEGFDTWISAADRIVLPYTKAWSSGVLARARIIGTPAILTPVGGLAEQAGPDDEIIRSDEELRRAFARLGDATSPDRTVDEADASSRRPGS